MLGQLFRIGDEARLTLEGHKLYNKIITIKHIHTQMSEVEGCYSIEEDNDSLWTSRYLDKVTTFKKVFNKLEQNV